MDLDALLRINDIEQQQGIQFIEQRHPLVDLAQFVESGVAVVGERRLQGIGAIGAAEGGSACTRSGR